ncbi:hypothetical protein JCM33374_g2933 [Metschnikowia sp. JCM 33374]|nr:hypothetical protein JCM33374_g2933 [Metschnikowia sp. JCM 33374]
MKALSLVLFGTLALASEPVGHSILTIPEFRVADKPAGLDIQNNQIAVTDTSAVVTFSSGALYVGDSRHSLAFDDEGYLYLEHHAEHADKQFTIRPQTSSGSPLKVFYKDKDTFMLCPNMLIKYNGLCRGGREVSLTYEGVRKRWWRNFPFAF